MKPFIQAFVRPHGLDVPATPLFVEQVEAMKGLKCSRCHRRRRSAFFWRWAIGRLRALRHNERYDRWVLSEREQAVEAAQPGRTRERKARERARRRAKARQGPSSSRQRQQEPQALADRNVNIELPAMMLTYCLPFTA